MVNVLASGSYQSVLPEPILSQPGYSNDQLPTTYLYRVPPHLKFTIFNRKLGTHYVKLGPISLSHANRVLFPFPALLFSYCNSGLMTGAEAPLSIEHQLRLLLLQFLLRLRFEVDILTMRRGSCRGVVFFGALVLPGVSSGSRASFSLFPGHYKL